jgi:surfeit locus 1 family protein
MSRFRPPRWSWLVLLPILALLLGLGGWQLRRAHEKEMILAAYGEAARRQPADLRADAPPARDLPVGARARGAYLGDEQLLLDNQSHDGRPGYHVWTPMRLAAGGLIVVDRGWIERSAADAMPQPPTPSAAATEVRGLWRTLPRPGLRLATAAATRITEFPAQVEYPTAADLSALLGEPVVDGVLLLDPAEPDGFVREWNPIATLPPSRHYGYAVQWFGLAAALLVLFVVVNRKPA